MILVRFSRKIRRTFSSKKPSVDLRSINYMGDIAICVDINSYMGGSIFWTGFHHLNELLFLRSYLKPDMTFIDIGANQGEFSLFASSILKQGSVLAFEPVQLQRGYLNTNIGINNFKNITVYDFGLSDKEDRMPIYTSMDRELHHGYHEGLSTLYSSESRNHIEQYVELKIFDNILLGNISRLDFIKIDIEGAELFALRGMTETLNKFKPIILIELNEETFNSAGYTISEMVKFLSSFGYASYAIRRGNLFPTTSFEKWGNYVFKIN